MGIVESISILKQGIDISLKAGAYQRSEDVALLHTAIVNVQGFAKQFAPEEFAKAEAELKAAQEKETNSKKTVTKKK